MEARLEESKASEQQAKMERSIIQSQAESAISSIRSTPRTVQVHQSFDSILDKNESVLPSKRLRGGPPDTPGDLKPAANISKPPSKAPTEEVSCSSSSSLPATVSLSMENSEDSSADVVNQEEDTQSEVSSCDSEGRHL